MAECILTAPMRFCGLKKKKVLACKNCCQISPRSFNGICHSKRAVFGQIIKALYLCVLYWNMSPLWAKDHDDHTHF